MRYRLRTLLILLAVLPPLLWGGYASWGRYLAWRERQSNQVRKTRLLFPPELDNQLPPQRASR
jgi:hypothetical protein